jgi:hypothetical protein|tara:strand:- start:452 stop:640 length:189 start_codon:yes stop_codon:yes gene_type:complete
MRGSAVICLLCLAACRNEPSFDERYEAAQERIEDTADGIDQELDPPQIGREANESRPSDSPE